MWCDLLNSDMCLCCWGGQKHSIFTHDNWKVMIWKDKYEKISTWNCLVKRPYDRLCKTK
jgi:hypothetical protein